MVIADPDYSDSPNGPAQVHGEIASLGFPAIVAEVPSFALKGIAMSKLRNRMIRDMQLAGLVEATQKGYLRAVRQLTAFYMVAPDRLKSDKALSGPIKSPAMAGDLG